MLTKDNVNEGSWLKGTYVPFEVVVAIDSLLTDVARYCLAVRACHLVATFGLDKFYEEIRQSVQTS